MKKLKILSILLVVVALLVAGCSGRDADTTDIATVNGELITSAQVDRYISLVILTEPDVAEMIESDEEHKAYLEESILNSIIQNTIIKQEVDRLNLEVDEEELVEALENVWEHLALIYETDDAQQQKMAELNIDEDELTALIRDNLYFNVYFEYVSDEVINQKLIEYIDNIIAHDYMDVSHILLESEDEALEVLQLLEEGNDFGELAGEYSIEPQASQSGGSLGAIYEGDYMKWDSDFLGAAFLLNSGEISGPVETVFGYHIIKGLNRRSAQELSYEEVDAEIRPYLEEYYFNDYFEKLWHDAEIEML